MFLRCKVEAMESQCRDRRVTSPCYFGNISVTGSRWIHFGRNVDKISAFYLAIYDKFAPFA